MKKVTGLVKNEVIHCKTKEEANAIGLQLNDSFCFSQKFWLGAVISWVG